MSLLELIPTKKKKAARIAPLTPVVFSRYEPPTFPGEYPVPTRLAGKLKDLGRRFLLVRLSERLAQLATAAVMLVSLQMFVDWLADLPFLVRALFLCVDLALLVFFVRKYILPIVQRPPDQQQCALLVEKHWPKLNGRVIATVQLAQPQSIHNPPELVHALQQETEARTVLLDFGEIVPLRPLLRRAGAALIVTALWICFLIVFAPSSTALLKRVFLLSAKVPRKTEVICLSGNKIIPVGDSVLLEAQARGFVPSHGLVTMTYDSGRIQEVTLDPEPEHPDRFSLKIDRMDESLHYVIQLNDGISDSFAVKVVPRPGVTTVDCVQVYPAYTGLPDVKRMVGNLALLAGSKLKIHTVANAKITNASLKLMGTNQTIPLTIGQPDGKDVSGEITIPATGLTGFSILLTNQGGITSGEETQYPIDIIPDQPPSIALTYPEQLEELCTLKAKPTIAFTATDDYGLAKVFLCYRTVQDPDAAGGDAPDTNAPAVPPTKIEMDLGGERPASLQRRYILDLSAIKPALTEGITIEYWMQAQDANDVTGPGIGESEHHTIKVVSEMEKRAEVMRRLMESLSATDDILENQKKANDSLGDVIQDKPEAK